MGLLGLFRHTGYMTRPGLEPGISGSGGRRLIHWANGPSHKWDGLLTTSLDSEKFTATIFVTGSMGEMDIHIMSCQKTCERLH